MTRWDALLADADNTLFDFEASQAIALENACKALDIAYQQELLAAYEDINAKLWAAYERKEVTQPELRRLRSERFLKLVGSSLEPDVFGDTYVDALAQVAVVIPGALEAIQHASARLPVVIITNGLADVQRRRVGASPFLPYLRGLAISGELGVAKPDPRIVQAAMEMAGAKDPARVLLLGDSLTADIAGAQAAGTASCWYNPRRLPCAHQPAPDLEIHDLSELARLL